MHELKSQIDWGKVAGGGAGLNGDGGDPPPQPPKNNKVICTELHRMGDIPYNVWLADIQYSEKSFSEQVIRGYHAWGVPYVKLMRRASVFARLAKYPTRWFAEDIAYRMGVLPRPNIKGWLLREVLFRPLCWSLGMFSASRDWKRLWA
jgi:hypothetical protein